jgi:hypothetical protein
MSLVDWVVVVVLVAIFVPHARFAVRYLRRPWYRTWEGRALLASAVAWSLISGGFLVNHWHEVPDWTWALFGAVAAVSGWIKDTLLTMADREHRRRAAAPVE